VPSYLSPLGLRKAGARRTSQRKALDRKQRPVDGADVVGRRGHHDFDLQITRLFARQCRSTL